MVKKQLRTASVSPASSGQPSIRFPALSFGDGLVDVIDSLGVLSHCNKLGFKRGYYKHLTLVDSASNQFRVVGARKIRTLPFNFTFRDFFELLAGNPRWEVELIFGPFSRITLDEAKNLILGSFKREKDYWEEMTDFEEFRGRIESAASLEQIFGAFKDFNKA
jgi:hypothetical protein